MTLQLIFSYLVHPCKGTGNPEEVHGARVPGNGRLYGMLRNIFDKAETDCRIPIRFVMGDDGSQENEVRSELISVVRSPRLDTGRRVAARLRDATTGKSGLGLLFLMLGSDRNQQKLVVSRFPADEGVLAEARGAALDIRFVEKIFLRSAKSYKAALYAGSSFDQHFWDGSAVDKQINLAHDHLANYWIRDFLKSDFKTTSKAGTKRLATALKAAIKATDSVVIKREILSATMLAGGLSGQRVSIDEFAARFNLSPETRNAIAEEVRTAALRSATFIFDANEFQRHAAYTSYTLDQGAILTGPTERFEECFDMEEIDRGQDRYRFTASGKIVDRKVRSTP